MYEIGPFRLDPDAEVLTQDGVPLPLGSRGVAVLAALVGHANQHLQKSAIIDAAWPGVVVEESNLAVQISAIRRVLARAPGGERWIETLSRRGYRFVGPVALVPGSGGGARRSNLHRALTSFVGRERELVEIKRLLPATRLLTLTGIGGIGKTRLAQQAASEVVDAFRDGAWFVDLAPLSQPDLVPSAVAQVLGVRAAPGRSLVDALQAQLEGRQLLLVLDNCEHMLERCVPFADSLLRRNALLTIIATSREPLHLAGEQVYPLPTLSLPDAAGDRDAVASSEAVQLFVDRARRHHPRFELTPPLVPAVARLCIHLDGIPLALELAAARVASLSVEQIDARLDDRFRLLSAQGRGGIARHQTLRATLDWSHDLLAEDKRAILRRCAVFVGGFTLDAAIFVAAIARMGASDITELLAQLVDRSLVIADTSAARARYRMLETTRAYALEKLEEAGETQVVRRRHAQFFAGLVEQASDAWLRMPDAEWCDLYLPELDNVRAALDFAAGAGGGPTLAARLAGGAGPLWTNLALWAESLQRLEAATKRVDETTPEAVRARLSLWLGVRQEGAPDQALPAFEQATALYCRCGDALALGDAMVRHARVLTTRGRHDEARALLAEAGPRLHATGSAKALGLYFAAAGFLKMETRDLAGARADYNQSLSHYRRAGADIPALVMLGNIANLTWAQGDLESAAAAYAENIALLVASSATRKTALGWAYCNYSGVLTEMGRLDEALEAARLGLPLFRNCDYLWLTVDHCALRAALAGHIEVAARLAGYSDARVAAKDATRQTNEARARARLQALLGKRLGADDLARLLSEGAKLGEEDAFRLALA